MFEKFTDHARRVVVLAADEARARHHDRLGTGHLLAGLLRECDGVAAHALHDLGLTAEDLTDRLGPPCAPTGPGPLPFTEHARHVLAQSLRQTALLGHDRIGTEHLLLALLDEDDCTGTRLLHALAPLDVDRLREHLRHHTPEQRRTPTAPDHRVSLELTDAEYARCTAAAARAHQPLDTWMREQILAAARRRDPGTDPGTGTGTDPGR
ncbi:Clp protease N-terminal domain-containing protein (plasmid) [Rhodococcus aetherivorans]|uniref:Clp protease N-terminal domain-containing protein n=1 Tax=Rhodococcus aetherivorans TaxID=191292 RepID=UPI0026EB69BA|nr:Clp protease N-terminal domain-containing protein [Rhodococcus aetherivorans]WKX02109.1 Clp protease N-terminal domain-containing protein [Rhodococcus aetherivorans]